MLRLQLVILLLFFVSNCCFSQIYSDRFQPDTIALHNPWTNLDFNKTDSSFQFAIISDLTGGYRKGIFPMAVPKIKSLYPEFVMSVGDLIEGYVEDSAQILRWWNQFDGWVNELESPFFYVPGNHDLSNSMMTTYWKKRYGRTYYHFIYQNILFLVLNTEDGKPSHISKTQVNYFKDVLKKYPAVDWTLLFFHKPLWMEEETGLTAIEEALQDRNYTVFAGHHHTYVKAQRFGRDYYKLGTTGGGSNLAGPAFGKIDHVAWVTMSADGPKVANLTLNGILPDDMQTAESEPHAINFLRSTEISHIPMLTAKDQLKQINTEISFNNRGTSPLHVNGKFFQHPQFQLSLSTIDTIIHAGEACRLPLNISIPEGISPFSQDPVVLHWNMKSEAVGKVFEQSGNYELEVLKIKKVKKATNNIVVDGKWDEWGETVFQEPSYLDYYPHTWKDASDCAMDLRYVHSDSTLYLALYVVDDDPLYNPYRGSWEQDGAELRIVLPNQKFIRLSFSPGNTPGDILLDRSQNWPESGQLTSLRTQDGFIAELSVTLEDLDILNEEKVTHFQLQCIVYDHDAMEDQYKGTKAFWQKQQPGSGTLEIIR